MTKEQYDALVDLKEKTLKEAKSILNMDTEINLYVEFTVHEIDPNDPIWKYQKPDTNFNKKEMHFTNKLWSPVKLFSKHFSKTYEP